MTANISFQLFIFFNVGMDIWFPLVFPLLRILYVSLRIIQVFSPSIWGDLHLIALLILINSFHKDMVLNFQVILMPEQLSIFESTL